MATIVKGDKRGRPGKWLVDYRDGAGIRRILTFDTQEQAKDALASKMVESRQHIAPVCDPNVTLDQYAVPWLEQVKATAKPRTHESYSDVYRVHVAPRFGGVKVRTIQRAHVKAFLVGKLSDKAPAMVKLIKAVLSTVMNAAVDDGLIPLNPCAGLGRKLKLSRPVTDDDDIQAMTREQFAAFLEATDAPYRPLFLTMERAGLRPGEAVALQWPDLDLTVGTARISRNISRGHHGSPKGNRPRTVDLSPQLADTLRRLLVERKAQTLRHGWGEVPALVFFTANRTPLDDSRLRKVFKRACVRAKLPGHFVPKSLRHTFGSLLAQAGESPQYIQQQMGHRDITTTMRIYARWFPTRPLHGGVHGLDDASGSKTVSVTVVAGGKVNLGGQIESMDLTASSCRVPRG